MNHVQVIAALTEALKTVLASAHPHPTYHPAMTRAWQHAESVLGRVTSDVSSSQAVCPLPRSIYDALDPGIRDVVVLLRSNGFDTTDSGDGVSKPPEGRVFDFPHVAVVTSPALLVFEAERLAALLGKPWKVEATWTVGEVAVLFVFRPASIDRRASERLMREEWK